MNGRDTGLLISSTGTARLRHRARGLPGRSAYRLTSVLARYLVWRFRTGE